MSTEATITCRVCAHGLNRATAVACATCSSPHHQDCWDFVEGCSTYGCGGKECASFLSVEKGLATSVELKPVSLDRTQLAIQWQRALGHLRVGARSVPRTATAGVVGSLASLGIAHLTIHQYLVDVWSINPAIVAVGLISGLLAPFVGSLQVRHPLKMALLGTFFAYTTMAFLVKSSVSELWGVAGIVLFASGMTLAASSLSEWIFGLRSWLAERTGRKFTKSRYVSTGILCYLGMLAILLACGGRIGEMGAVRLALFALAAVFCAGHPLEKGKSVYRDSLEDGERPLISPSTQGPSC